MLRSHQVHISFNQRLRRAAPLGAVTCAAMLAACSADISRLEKPSYNVAERAPIPQEPIGRRNAGGPPAYDNAGWGDSGPRAGAQPSSRVDRVVSLPETSQPVNPSIPFDAPRKPKTAAVTPASGAASGRSTSAPILAGATVDVQPGDSLYALSKRHNVSIAALMDLNGLKNATLKPGQKIILPANARRPIAKPAEAQPATSIVGQAPAPLLPPIATAPLRSVPQPVAHVAAGDWDGSYVVKSGDSLYGIARTHKIQVAELQRVNAITDAMKMKPGMTLKVPSGTVAASVVAAPSPALMPAAAPPSATPAAVVSGGVRLLNPPADALPAKEAAAPAAVRVAGPATATAASTASTKFRWPARGAMLAGFGKRPDGAHNDGINIAVAAGTDIAASDAGTVAYAGSEIKAYGNLVLIRHDGGWVTAYAHADQILVKRGDAVTRGQIIAKAGSTGSVDQPQVHFELRQGSKPVDPAPHMEK